MHTPGSARNLGTVTCRLGPTSLCPLVAIFRDSAQSLWAFCCALGVATLLPLFSI